MLFVCVVCMYKQPAPFVCLYVRAMVHPGPRSVKGSLPLCVSVCVCVCVYTQVFVEQCRELDIAVAVAPRGVGSIVNVIKRQQNAAGSFSGAAGGGAPNLSRPSSGPAQRSLATTSQRGTLSGSAGSSAGITQGFDKLGKLFTVSMSCVQTHTPLYARWCPICKRVCACMSVWLYKLSTVSVCAAYTLHVPQGISALLCMQAGCACSAYSSISHPRVSACIRGCLLCVRVVRVGACV